MVRASHVIFSAYGFWLPNDPRGSWSDFVGAWKLVRFGKATEVSTRASVAELPHDTHLRRMAKEALKYPPVSFTGLQARSIGRGFALAANKAGLKILACSILPEHVHMVLARHRSAVEQIVNFLKGEATRQLIREGLYPLAAFADGSGGPPRTWGRGLWKVYLDSEEDLRRAILYIQDKPVKEGKPQQRWSFVHGP